MHRVEQVAEANRLGVGASGVEAKRAGVHHLGVVRRTGINLVKQGERLGGLAQGIEALCLVILLCDLSRKHARPSAVRALSRATAQTYPSRGFPPAKVL